jgi:hypothetical protein
MMILASRKDLRVLIAGWNLIKVAFHLSVEVRGR